MYNTDAGGNQVVGEPLMEATMDLAQAADTYDLITAAGDVLIKKVIFYVSTVGATFTSVSVQTDDTTSLELLSAVEGAVAELTAGRNLKAITTPFRLSDGQKIQFTIVGATGTGEIKVAVIYQAISANASIS